MHTPEESPLDELTEAARAVFRRWGAKSRGLRTLTPERRSEIARNAAKARWERKRQAEIDTIRPMIEHWARTPITKRDSK